MLNHIPLKRWASFLCVFSLLGLSISPSLVLAQTYVNPPKKTVTIPKKIKHKTNKKLAWVVINAHSGEILLDYKATDNRYPASVTKTMTAYLVLERLRQKKLRLSDSLLVSKNASSKCPLKLHLKPGSRILLKDALIGMLVHSANDASAVLAEKISKTESSFATLMTQKARELGLKKTTFRNASGLPDKAQVTCALDLAKLCQAVIRDFPQYYHYFSIKRFTFRGTTYKNANKLLETVHGVDGLKTGYTPISGFHLAVSAKRGNTRIIAVVMGTQSPAERNHKMTSLVEEGFRIAQLRAEKKRSLSPKKPKSPPQKPPSEIGQKPSNPSKSDLPDTLELETLLKEEKLAPLHSPDLVDTLDQELSHFLDAPKKDNTPSESWGAEPVSPPVKPTPQKLLAPRELSSPKTPIPLQKKNRASSAWAVQVAAFREKSLCQKEVDTLRKQFPTLLKKTKATILGPSGGKRKKFFVSRFIHLTQDEASGICSALAKKTKNCMVISPSPTQSPPSSQKSLPRKPRRRTSRSR